MLLYRSTILDRVIEFEQMVGFIPSSWNDYDRCGLRITLPTTWDNIDMFVAGFPSNRKNKATRNSIGYLLHHQVLDTKATNQPANIWRKASWVVSEMKWEEKKVHEPHEWKSWRIMDLMAEFNFLSYSIFFCFYGKLFIFSSIFMDYKNYNNYISL